MASIGNIDSVKLMRNITLTVKLERYREMRFRLWIGRHLFALAALIMNCNIKFEDATK